MCWCLPLSSHVLRVTTFPGRSGNFREFKNGHGTRGRKHKVGEVSGKSHGICVVSENMYFPFLKQLLMRFKQSIIILSEQMQKHCSYCTSTWGDITCREMTVKKVGFKFLFKCRQCHWWLHFCRKTVPGFCRRNTERSITDCLKTCLWHSKIRWWQIILPVSVSTSRFRCNCKPTKLGFPCVLLFYPLATRWELQLQVQFVWRRQFPAVYILNQCW